VRGPARRGDLGLKLPSQDGWPHLPAQDGASAEVRRALALLELALPATPLQIKTRYRELAMRWHRDRNDSAEAHEHMTALNSAVELLSGIDTRILSGEGGASYSGDEDTKFNLRDDPFTMAFGFGERSTLTGSTAPILLLTPTQSISAVTADEWR
jgi:curved DNA-binding protein CbpA